MPAPRPARPGDGVAWVTGASSGIGLAVAARLVAEGWTVAVSARRESELQHFAAAHPGRVIVAAADVTNEAAMRTAFDRIEAQGRPIALAICNAGTWKMMGATDFDLASFRQQIEVNVIGTATTLATVLPGMIRRGSGQVAIVASVAGYRGLPMAAAYGTSKAALIHLAETLKFDLDRAGVMINLVNPGFVRTPMTDDNPFPMPFLLEPEDAAERIVRGLRRGGFEVTFPAGLAWPLKLARVLPYFLFFAIVGAATRKR
jgi:NAD(P)-dependent dehydrogenase (short-subunit alcohol dehydrogenase family)